MIIKRRALRRLAFEAGVFVAVVIGVAGRRTSGARGCEEGCTLEIRQTRQSAVSDPIVLHTEHFRILVPVDRVLLSVASRSGRMLEGAPRRPALRVTAIGAEGNASCIEFR